MNHTTLQRRTFLRLAIFATLAATPALARGGNPPQQPGTSTTKIKVMVERSDKPVPNAAVTITMDPANSAVPDVSGTTDSTGMLLTDVQPGTYKVSATANGMTAITPLKLGKSKSVRSITVTLPPDAKAY